jgi:hypothetical protein
MGEGGVSEPIIRVLSLGAGVQSATLALMAAAGEISPMPDVAIFADTGDEKRGTYRYLDWLDGQLPFPILRPSRGSMSLSESTLALYRDGSGEVETPPFFFPGGMLAKHCSKEWKTRVVVRTIRAMLKLARGERAPSGTNVEVLIGISRDEAHRMKPSEVPWITNRFPLVDRNMRRSGCVQWLVNHRKPIPPRSACVYCPYQSDAEFSEMKGNHVDDDWSRATSFDTGIRDGGNGTTGPLYVSRHCRPLAEVDFDRQPDLFGNECEGMCGV